MKSSTAKIADDIYELGISLGFESHKEFTFSFINFTTYSPRYDVVWLLPTRDMIDVSNLQQKTCEKAIQFYLDYIVIAAFEIEGSTTSSKNQIGNVANLAASNAFLKFLVTDNAGAGKEKDTFRRAVKIYNSYSRLIGYKNFLVLDSYHINNINKISFSKTNTIPSDNNFKIDRSKVGGETTSLDVIEKLFKNDVIPNNLHSKQNWEPTVFNNIYNSYKNIPTIQDDHDFLLLNKYYQHPNSSSAQDINNVKKAFYIPKIDFVFGIYFSGGLLQLMKSIKSNLREQHILYPILQCESFDTEYFFPFLGCEAESCKNKHMHGGIMNIGTFTYIGFTASDHDLRRDFDFFINHLGLKNVFYLQL